MPNINGGGFPAEGEPPTVIRSNLRNIFADVYRFILQAVNEDRATAETLFEDYLDGRLSEQLLSISRACVSADQAGSSIATSRGMAERAEQRGTLEVSDDVIPTAAS
jgi:hypothetical protein